MVWPTHWGEKTCIVVFGNNIHNLTESSTSNTTVYHPLIEELYSMSRLTYPVYIALLKKTSGSIMFLFFVLFFCEIGYEWSESGIGKAK